MAGFLLLFARFIKSDDLNVEAGVRFGLAPASDRLVLKLMISCDIYKPFQNSKKDCALQLRKTDMRADLGGNVAERKRLRARDLGRIFMTRFIDLADREVPAVAISAVEEDSHIYMTFVEDKVRYPGSARPQGQSLQISITFQSESVSKLMTGAMSGKRVASCG